MESTATQTNETEVKEEVIEEVVNTQPSVEANVEKVESFDPSKIDARVKEHFEKEYSTRYADYEPSKKAAQELNAIKNDPGFQRWLQERNAPTKPSPFEITDDQFTAGLTDKGQFVKLVQEAARHLVEQQVGPKLQQTEQHFQFEAKKTELSGVVQKYPDFKDLDKRGLIEPIIRKYPNVGFEDAYWMAKQHTYKEDVAKAARGQVTERKGAVVERGDNAPSARRNVVKVENRLEAMEKVAEDFRAGREVAEYEYD